MVRPRRFTSLKTCRLIVRNTQDQLDLVDTIINSGPQGTGPIQVEIESKFVEIQQNNLKELSFDVLLGQFNLPGTKNIFAGGGTSGTSPALNYRLIFRFDRSWHRARRKHRRSRFGDAS